MSFIQFQVNTELVDPVDLRDRNGYFLLVPEIAFEHNQMSDAPIHRIDQEFIDFTGRSIGSINSYAPADGQLTFGETLFFRSNGLNFAIYPRPIGEPVRPEMKADILVVSTSTCSKRVSLKFSSSARSSEQQLSAMLSKVVPLTNISGTNFSTCGDRFSFTT